VPTNPGREDGSDSREDCHPAIRTARAQSAGKMRWIFLLTAGICQNLERAKHLAGFFFVAENFKIVFVKFLNLHCNTD
jgi:hypothetical protein